MDQVSVLIELMYLSGDHPPGLTPGWAVFPGWIGAPNARHQTRAADGANRELTPVLSAMLTASWLAL